MWITKALKRVTLAHRARSAKAFKKRWGFYPIAGAEGEDAQATITRLTGELATANTELTTAKDTAGKGFFGGLSEEVRANPSMEKFKDKTGEEVARSYIEIQKLVGMDKLPLPKDLSKATPEEWAVIYSRLGRPETAEGYKLNEVKRPDGYPEADPEEMKALFGKAHELGILPHQLNGLFEHFMGGEFAKFTRHNEDTKTAIATGRTELMGRWGKAFVEREKIAETFINTHASDKAIQKLKEGGLTNDPDIIEFLYNAGSKMSESALGGKPEGGLTKTPEEAKREIAKIMGDKTHAYHADKTHPEHDLAVQKMADLHEQAYPNEREKPKE